MVSGTKTGRFKEALLECENLGALWLPRMWSSNVSGFIPAAIHIRHVQGLLETFGYIDSSLELLLVLFSRPCTVSCTRRSKPAIASFARRKHEGRKRET